MELPALRTATLPAAVAAAVQHLRAAGARVWIVGGAVRDAALGLPVDDWDLAVDREPAALRALFPAAELGDDRLGWLELADGVVVTALRAEGGYSDRRHPDWVRFVTSPADDAPRRDFTVNALYLDPDGDPVLDPSGRGIEDLQARRLRVLGDPRGRLEEDPLRLLRGARLAASCALLPEPATEAALRAVAPAVRHLSPERIRAELEGALLGRGRGAALRHLRDWGLWDHCVPDMPFDSETGVVAADALQRLPAGQADLCWALLALVGGKAGSADRAAAGLQRLGAPRALERRVLRILSTDCRDPGSPELAGQAHRVAAALAEARGEPAPALQDFEDPLARLDPPVGGAEVLALGIAPGPRVGAVLAALRERLLENPEADRNAALVQLADIVRKAVKRSGPEVDIH